MVNSNISKWYDWLVGYVQKPIKSAIRNYFLKVKSSILRWYDCAKMAVRDSVEKGVNLMPQIHEKALKAAHKSCRKLGLSEPGIEVYTN